MRAGFNSLHPDNAKQGFAKGIERRSDVEPAGETARRCPDQKRATGEFLSRGQFPVEIWYNEITAGLV